MMAYIDRYFKSLTHNPKEEQRFKKDTAKFEALRAKGSDAVLYGRSVSAWVDLLFAMAGQVLGTEGSYLEALQEFKAF